MRPSSFIIMSALSALLAAGPAVAADRNFSVGNFSKLRVTGSMDVKVSTGSAASVRATGSAADLERLEIAVRGDTLVIGSKSGSWNWSRDGVDVYVTVPSLSAAALTGSGDVEISRMAAPSVDLAVTGSGDMDVKAVDSPSVAMAVSGSGDLDVAGRCGKGSISLRGSGDVDADDLACSTLQISVMGSGDVSARASGTAAIAIMGSGDVTVVGGARCTTSARGSGTANCS